MRANSFRELNIWQEAHALLIEIHRLSAAFPKTEIYSLTSQLRRAAASVGANIAEGYGRYSYKENIQFCYYARGSMFETRHWLRRAPKRKLLTTSQEKELKEILKPLPVKLNAYIKSIKLQQSKPK